ncbi:hypothetical protein VPH35_132778 [Triticum aestivum]
MGLWNYGRKGKHDREAGSSLGRRRGSVKNEEPASPPRSSRRAPAPAPLAIAPRPVGERARQYLCADVPIPPVPASSRARRDEIARRRRLLPDDLYYDHRYAPDSELWDTWLLDEHDTRRASYFAGTVSGPRRARREVRGRQWDGLEEAMALSAAGDVALLELQMAAVKEEEERREEAMEEEPVAAFHPGLVGQQWSWSCTAPEMADAVGP